MKYISKFYFLPLILAAASCAAPQRHEFNLSMRTVSDDGLLLEGVQVFHGDQDLGTTSKSGLLYVDVEASSGSSFDVRFECPKGYVADRDHVVVPLRDAKEVAEGEEPKGSANALSLTLQCRPNERKATVVVKANMANLPVRLGDTIVGKTNAEGVAYVSLQFPAKQVFELSLDTSSQSLLFPRNPHFPFVMPGRDEVFVIQESFRVVQPPPPPKIKKKKKVKKVRPEAPTKKPEIKRPVRINGVS
jgi:hypothetical protein